MKNKKMIQQIELTSPMSDYFAGFILANSFCLDCNKPPLSGQCVCEKPRQWPVVKENAEEGKDVVICGSGPSLKKALKTIRRVVKNGGHVWGCNDALMWLSKHNHPVTHGVAIDQSPDLYEDSWVPEPPDVKYLLATSVSPRLIGHLTKHDRNDITLFHSLVGVEQEQALYGLLYEITALVASGLNVVNRSLGLALAMGYRTIYLAGADCALGPNDTFHVHGDKAEGIILRGKINGKMWATKADMLVSAVDLAVQKRILGSRIQFVGHTLPRVLATKDDAFLDRCVLFGGGRVNEAGAEATLTGVTQGT